MANHNIKISASILSANFLDLGSDIRAVESAGIDSLHLDVMDNHMAPSVSFGPPIISPIRSMTELTLDAHLMIDAPWLFFDAYIDCGVNEICFHIEAYGESPSAHEDILSQSRTIQQVNMAHLQRDIAYLKSKGVKPGITINPNTDPSVIYPILDDIYSVLVMSVHPGFSGQSFIPSTLQKVAQIRERFTGDIKVDGGVNNTNSTALIDSGANILISASYLFGAPNINDAIDALRN